MANVHAGLDELSQKPPSRIIRITFTLKWSVHIWRTVIMSPGQIIPWFCTLSRKCC